MIDVSVHYACDMWRSMMVTHTHTHTYIHTYIQVCDMWRSMMGDLETEKTGFLAISRSSLVQEADVFANPHSLIR